MASNEIIPSDDSYDTLSFCDLPMDNQSADVDTFFECDSDEEDHNNEVFEFLTSPECEPSQSIMFCGKPIIEESAPKQKKGLLARKDSFKKSRSSRSDPSSGSGSFRFGGPPKVAAAPGSCYRSTSGGGSRKQPRMMIGLVRVEPTMELSEIRKRQRRRRSPVPMFSGAGGGGQAGKPESDSSGNNWGLFRPLRCRVQFVAAITKASFCCISHA